MRTLNTVEEKILDRALYLMGKTRSCDVSIRAIAKEAKVNVSAINYYFRTKEEMLRQIKSFYIENVLSACSILKDETYDDEERLILFSNEIMEYTLRFPGITVILREALNLEEADETSLSIINVTKELHDGMNNLLAKVIKGSGLTLEYSKMMFISALIYPIENMDIVDFDHTIMEDKEKRLEYVKHVLKILKDLYTKK